MIDTSGRQHAVAAVGEFFDSDHLPPRLREIAGMFEDLATALLREIPDDPELTVALRKLLESKDAAVRARVRQIRAEHA
jgi:hypothetical protein